MFFIYSYLLLPLYENERSRPVSKCDQPVNHYFIINFSETFNPVFSVNMPKISQKLPKNSKIHQILVKT